MFVIMTQTAIDNMAFEDAMGELETIVRNLETGQTKLDESISAYERGVALKKHCEKRLNDARLKIEKITLNQNGTPKGTEPFDPENQ
jgi:exodeoxyribonuclease VII small subunit